MTAPTGTPQQERPAKPWLILAILCLGFFMILLDTTVVNIAIPDMSTSLDASLDQILWIINAYVLVYAVLLITAGRLGDIFGPKRLFILGLVVFTAASAACGLASTPEQLIVFRVIQGVGGALLTPQTLSTITVIFPADKRGVAFGVWGSVAGIATVAGPTLGGYLVTDFGWEWIFFVNVPVGIVTVVLAVVAMPDLRLNRRHRLDWTGTALASVGLFLLVYGLIEGEPHDWGRVWGPITIVEVIGAGVVVLAVFLYHQYLSRAGEPLIPFTIFKDRNFAVMSWVSAAIAFSMLGLFLPLVIYLQSVLGLTALQAGIAVAPLSLLSMVIAPFAGRLSDRAAGKWVLVAGLSLWCAGNATVVALAEVGTGQWGLLPGLLIAGAGLGMVFAPLQTIAMRHVPPQQAGAASGLINTARQLGAVIGSAAVGALLQAQLTDKLTAAARTNAADLPPDVRQPFVDAVAGATGGSLHIGAGQSGAALPADVPEQYRQALTDIATRTFHEGFTNAMKATLLLPLIVLAVAAVSCLFVRTGRTPTAPPTDPLRAEEPAQA
ncbi:MFS transporter [Asanoa ishikariensis]|uniref:Drug resistance transporter, EmrB/QacA subfamily n=1 Tax=Asanoa ishikariensis TaxID=137265 RepID=A0A1H3NDE8_9ACTN|nr:DHA2 family efflux MFS transporter permease subunit [Asanoa ishikariensis]GIF68703.1 MFS transporter [Asanoa ishikariensis]SDY86690.1 drug resistance transporter, EmrB/QacA subfamily [Asanoa ishikariensis]